MSYNCCSGRFSTYSLGSSLNYPGSSCRSSCPSNLVYNTNLCFPSTYQVGSLYQGCQETCCEPISCQRSHLVSSPCQTSCFRPRTSTFCSPYQATYTGSLSFGSRSCHSLGYGSRSCYSQDCGSRSSFRPFGYRVCGFPSLRNGSGFYFPTYFPSSSFRSLCY
ncbi:keratin-associated protein 13-3-like [Rhynchocyon petersi]